MRLAVSFVVLAALASPSGARADYVGPAHVVDGDTIAIGAIRIRLFGIDAPESRQTCLNAARQRYGCGQLSRQHLIALIAGHAVSCEDVGPARVGVRRWGRCVANGINLQAAMVRAGHAKAFLAHGADYVGLEQEAKNQKLGLWQGPHTDPKAVRTCKRGGATAKNCS